jgi:hypothetical protein
MAGGSYRRALADTFVAELLSMNFLMAGMVPTAMTLRIHIPSASEPSNLSFWFVMSMALLVGFVVAYPINWWLVAHHLKHGMMTVRRVAVAAPHAHAAPPPLVMGAAQAAPMAMDRGHATQPPLPVMVLISFLVLAAGIAAALLLRLL